MTFWCFCLKFLFKTCWDTLSNNFWKTALKLHQKWCYRGPKGRGSEAFDFFFVVWSKTISKSSWSKRSKETKKWRKIGIPKNGQYDPERSTRPTVAKERTPEFIIRTKSILFFKSPKRWGLSWFYVKRWYYFANSRNQKIRHKSMIGLVNKLPSSIAEIKRLYDLKESNDTTLLRAEIKNTFDKTQRKWQTSGAITNQRLRKAHNTSFTTMDVGVLFEDALGFFFCCRKRN